MNVTQAQLDLIRACSADELAYQQLVGLVQQLTTDTDQHLRALLDSVDDLIFTLDRDQRHTGLYGQGVARSGLTPDAALGRTARQLFDEARAALYEAYNQRALAGEHITYDWQDEQGRTIQTALSPLVYPSGEIVGVVGVNRDISAIRQMQDDLRASQLFAQRIAELTPRLIYIYDLNLQRNIYANRALSEILGYTVEEVQALNAAFIPTTAHPDETDLLVQHRARLQTAADGEIIEADYRFRHKNGDWRTLNVRETIFQRNPDGTPSQVLGIGQDVTEQAESARALAESQRFVSRITSTIPDLIYVYDTQARRVIYTNGRVEAILGYSEEEIMAADAGSLEMLIHPDDVPVYEERLAPHDRFDGDTITEAEVRVRHKNGEWRWLNVRDRALAQLPDGQVSQLLAIVRDVTAQKEALAIVQEQAQLEAALANERELHQLKTEMMIRIAHEFRTPLSIIQTSAEILGRYIDRMDAEQRQAHLEKMRSQVYHISVMLDAISAIVRNRFNPQNLEFTRFDLRLTCGEALSKVQQTLGGRHHFVADLPEHPCTIMADEEVVQDVVSALLANAVTYSVPGTTITMRLSVSQQWATLTVQDTGIGILPQDEPHLYEPFFRGSNIGDTRGVGLGLPIVRSAVDVLGGTVAFESTPGEGTTFTVRLPLRRSGPVPPDLIPRP